MSGSGSACQASATAIDNIGVDGFFIIYRYGTGEAVNESMDARIRLDLPRLPEGDLTFKFSAVDEEGNWNSTEEFTIALVNVAPTILPISTWPFFFPELFNNLQHDALFYLGRGGTENGSHRLGRSALLANHLANVLLGHRKFQHGGLSPFYLLYGDLFGVVHQSLSNIIDQILQGVTSFAAVKNR